MNEKYPDPLAKCAEKFNSSAEWKSTKAPTSGRGDGRGDEVREVSGEAALLDEPAVAPAEPNREGEAPAEPLPLARPVVTSAVDENSTLTNGQGFESQTRLARRLASGRRMSPVERRRLEGLVARRGTA